jgi:hypothetical protein
MIDASAGNALAPLGVFAGLLWERPKNLPPER